MYLTGCNDNPTSQQFASAYKKLLVRCEVTCNTGNCLNDVTQILEVSSRKKDLVRNAVAGDSSEIEMLRNYDLQHPLEDICERVFEYVENTLTECLDSEEQIAKASLSYLAALVEQMVIRTIKNRRNNACLKCVYVFTENDLTDDDFI